MTAALDPYRDIVGDAIVDQLGQLARSLRGASVVHVNSTRTGGGVAEILRWLVPLKNELGIPTSWRVVGGDAGFFDTTKRFHNGLQGRRTEVSAAAYEHYLEVNRANAAEHGPPLRAADIVVVDPPPPPPRREGGGAPRGPPPPIPPPPLGHPPHRARGGRRGRRG